MIIAMRVLIAALLLLGSPPARAARVVAFGDSWAAGAGDILGAAFIQAGMPEMSVQNAGVSGSTADVWANAQPGALPLAVSLNPDAQWVWLSIGGNDLFAHYAAGNGGQTAPDNTANIRKMLDALFAEHPTVRVVMFGYDYVNFEQSTECILLATQTMPGLLTPQINQAFQDGVHAVQAAIAADYPNVIYVPSIRGTLQKAAGVPGAPNPLLPSPAKYMSDCIHPTAQGYLLLMSALVAAVDWGAPVLPPTPPSAAISAPATEGCSGATLPFTSTSTGATTLRWLLDAALVGTGPSLQLGLPAAGPHTLALEATGSGGVDVATVALTVHPVPAPVIAGPGSVVEAAVATYGTDAVGTHVWGAVGGEIVPDGASATVTWGAPGPGSVSVSVTNAHACTGAATLPVAVAAAAPDPGPMTGQDAGQPVIEPLDAGGPDGGPADPDAVWPDVHAQDSSVAITGDTEPSSAAVDAAASASLDVGAPADGGLAPASGRPSGGCSAGPRGSPRPALALVLLWLVGLAAVRCRPPVSGRCKAKA